MTTPLSDDARSSRADATRALLDDVARRSDAYLRGLDARPVAPSRETLARLDALDVPLPAHPTDERALLAQLDELGSPATVASAGGRYFGFVIGGSLPAALAANWLAGAWDQDAGLHVMGPSVARIESIAHRWLVELLALPVETAAGFVTGATMANFTALAAARHALLARRGWDVELRGLFGAPEIRVVVGDEVHVSVLKALSLLGFGRDRVVRVPADGQGRMRAELLPELDEMTIVCIQAGNVNTGAFDPARAIVDPAHRANAWVHVDGAFGLWAAATPARVHLVDGFADADSWALDAHKWLNVPYDSGVAFCRHDDAIRGAMTAHAAYLVRDENVPREPDDYVPDFSRRARGVEIYAALRTLGRSGVADLIERCCRHATRFADALRDAGFEVLNDVRLNQVLVRFGDDARTRRTIAAVQADGTCWCGGTVWHGMAAMRISLSSWVTSEDDVERSIAAIVRVARAEAATR